MDAKMAYQLIHFIHLKGRRMKKHFVILLIIWSASIIAQVGPQPLYISNITLIPSCGNTATISVTAAGGQPTLDGFYTYQIGSPINEIRVAKTVTFTATSGSIPILLISDSSSNALNIDQVASFTPSQTTSVSMDVSTLPLGNGKGCILLSVTNPGGLATNLVTFGLRAFTPTDLETPSDIKQVKEAPFTATFLSLPSALLNASVVNIDDGCAEGSTFNFIFPFPQGLGNALKAYIFNKYCSCPLSSSAISVPIP